MRTEIENVNGFGLTTVEDLGMTTVEDLNGISGLAGPLDSVKSFASKVKDFVLANKIKVGVGLGILVVGLAVRNSMSGSLGDYTEHDLRRLEAKRIEELRRAFARA